MNLVERYVQQTGMFRARQRVNWNRLRNMTYSQSRELAPIYTMGNPSPEMMVRGRSSLAGTMTFDITGSDLSEIEGIRDNRDIEFDYAWEGRQTHFKIINFDVIEVNTEVTHDSMYVYATVTFVGSRIEIRNEEAAPYESVIRFNRRRTN